MYANEAQQHYLTINNRRVLCCACFCCAVLFVLLVRTCNTLQHLQAAVIAVTATAAMSNIYTPVYMIKL
jgi:hypothetical protein